MAELYDLYGRLVFRIILRTVLDESVAEDLTQDAFLRVWNGVRGFDEKRGALGSWITAVARNTAIDYLRSPRARNARTSVELKDVDGAVRSSTFEDWIVNFDRGRLLRGALEKLTASQRLVLTLSYVEGMSHAEIARSLNRPLGTVKTWVRTALRVLHAQLQYSA
jgi:RNA polymerase sigma-70 factor (ECF subfamily)